MKINKTGLLLLSLSLFTASIGIRSAQACLGPAEFYSVIHPQMLGALKTFKLTVGDVLALGSHIQVLEGEKLMTKMSEVNGDTYYLVSDSGSITLSMPKSNQKPVTLEAVQPMRYRSLGCGDHRK